ncbi:hypothetical protein GCM10010174_32610 [Kutzneria viridogrisea]|uniref:Low molecular weight protein antigen 6 PH domain-containing protein n=2 Tax=Kutzneria TaxID=43356 RepID=A0ABR6BQQ6_9PSEU|nr:PH domain-containing protein [Kutzneria albida]AHH93393.1 putative secreted protein [Kutzneria albida DSM 43870]MBA8929222.1 hypothetical protein [Kutzneria viridogrisea]
MTQRSWSPQVSLVALGWALTAAAVLWVVLSAQDPPGRLLLGVVALLLALLSLHGTVARPRLSADEHGLTVRGLFGRRSWPWPQVRVRVDHLRRLGRTVSSLELTVLPDEELVILGRLDLGADPVDVVEQLRALRP